MTMMEIIALIWTMMVRVKQANVDKRERGGKGGGVINPSKDDGENSGAGIFWPI